MVSGWVLVVICKSPLNSAVFDHSMSLSIRARSLPRFWYYSFHFMDYQKYAFELLATVGFALWCLLATFLTPLILISLIWKVLTSAAVHKSAGNAYAHIPRLRLQHVRFQARTFSLIWILAPFHMGNGLPSSLVSLSFTVSRELYSLTSDDIHLRRVTRLYFALKARSS